MSELVILNNESRHEARILTGNVFSCVEKQCANRQITCDLDQVMGDLLSGKSVRLSKWTFSLETGQIG